jgi:hypothetical protein
MPLKRPQTVHIRTTHEHHQYLKDQAKSLGLSLNEYCVDMLADGFEDLFKINEDGELCPQSTTQPQS